MSTILGREGSLTFDATVVAETRSWNITRTQGNYDANVIGSGEWDRTVGGRKMWTSEVECFYDPTDTTGNADFAIGDEVACIFYPEGDTSTNVSYTGTARVEEVSDAQSEDGLVELSIKLKGIGELVKGVVA